MLVACPGCTKAVEVHAKQAIALPAIKTSTTAGLTSPSPPHPNVACRQECPLYNKDEMNCPSPSIFVIFVCQQNATAMSLITNVESWGNHHRPGFLDFFRIALGIFITYKGLQFVTNMDELQNTTAGITTWFAGAVLAHYIVFAHILGGPLIVAGLFTRFASLIQIPILIGAVFLVNAPAGHLSLGNYMELWLSVIVLLGLIVCVVFGAGRYSLDARRRKDIQTAH